MTFLGDAVARRIVDQTLGLTQMVSGLIEMAALIKNGARFPHKERETTIGDPRSWIS
jgi:hypothetical protein